MQQCTDHGRHEIERLREAAQVSVFDRAFGQPSGQSLPKDFLALLVELDRSKR